MELIIDCYGTPDTVLSTPTVQAVTLIIPLCTKLMVNGNTSSVSPAKCSQLHTLGGMMEGHLVFLLLPILYFIELHKYYAFKKEFSYHFSYFSHKESSFIYL